MTTEIKGKNLIITIPLQEPTASASGKTFVVASSRGNKETEATVKFKGQDTHVVVGVNAYVYANPKS